MFHNTWYAAFYEILYQLLILQFLKSNNMEIQYLFVVIYCEKPIEKTALVAYLPIAIYQLPNQVYLPFPFQILDKPLQ